MIAKIRAMMVIINILPYPWEMLPQEYGMQRYK